MTKHRRKRKSYNPFKMWGSWVGALILFIVGLLFWIENNFMCEFNCTSFEMVYIKTIMGFLIGWGIHSLFRKLSK